MDDVILGAVAVAVIAGFWFTRQAAGMPVHLLRRQANIGPLGDPTQGPSEEPEDREHQVE